MPNARNGHRLRRITALVDYFAEYVPFVVALLPEDAQALDDYYRIQEI